MEGFEPTVIGHSSLIAATIRTHKYYLYVSKGFIVSGRIHMPAQASIRERAAYWMPLNGCWCATRSGQGVFGALGDFDCQFRHRRVWPRAAGESVASERRASQRVAIAIGTGCCVVSPPIARPGRAPSPR